MFLMHELESVIYTVGNIARGVCADCLSDLYAYLCIDILVWMVLMLYDSIFVSIILRRMCNSCISILIILTSDAMYLEWKTNLFAAKWNKLGSIG